MAKFDNPMNRRKGSLWAVVTAVIVLAVLYFMFFSSREGELPSATDGGTVTTGSGSTSSSPQPSAQ